MSEPARAIDSRPALRVAISARPIQRAAWTRLLEDAGYDVVGESVADVILSDGATPPSSDRPVVRVGDGQSEAQGHLAATATVEQIEAALRAAASGLLVASPDIAETGFRALRDIGEKALLTPRELEVLGAIAEGLTNKAIARKLDISLHTVKFHVESLFRKLGVKTRSEATARALERLRESTITI